MNYASKVALWGCAGAIPFVLLYPALITMRPESRCGLRRLYNAVPEDITRPGHRAEFTGFPPELWCPLTVEGPLALTEDWTSFTIWSFAVIALVAAVAILGEVAVRSYRSRQ